MLLSVLVVAASAGFGKQLDDSMAAPGTDSQAAADLLASADSGAGGLTAYVVATPGQDGVTFVDSRPARVDLDRLESALSELPKTLGTTQEVAPDGRVALLRVQYPEIGELATSDLAALKDVLAESRASSSLQLEAGGDLYFSFEQPPANVGEVVGLVVAAVILVVAFGSLLAAGLPLAVALFGLLVGASLIPLLGLLLDVPVWAPVMAAMVGLGVGIDYALFLLSRHREYLTAGVPAAESVGRSLATAGQAVVFAGTTVVVAILGLAFAGLPFVTAGGVAVAAVVLVMVLAAITLLPALLGLAGQRLQARGLLARRGKERRRGTDAAVLRWSRWGAHVTRHAAAYAVAGTLLLLALAAPVLALRLGLPDQGSYPQERTERRAYDLVAEGFGPGATGPMVVAVDLSRDPSVVEPLVSALAADPGIASAAAAPVEATSDVAVIIAQPTTTPQDAETVRTLDRLRSQVLPAALAGSPATAHVGGYTATMSDLSQRVEERLPIILVAVVAMSYLLLMVLFRSVLVPLKAAALNLLSVAASYGVLVMVFQWGWAASLIGLESTVPIISFIPLFMFAILFGLSMDYEVFLLSRVREEYLRTGDNGYAVVRGIGVTARTISCGAAIMVSVFVGFGFGDDPVLKMLGLGLATAVFLDATLVRLVLVPATMKLLGDANWWLPAWLDRLLPKLDLDGAADTLPAEDEPDLGQQVPQLEVRNGGSA
ncbi:MMPL family transporter [Aeromicrobium wangtongii]|uniref:MMPL family transporter n=1 Tax=Aeromicrobium wangtongii TaxID=2969247 RepID=A0ABY5MAX1_9ACTN|nr:MMPL family transporter [Aeromicrobium wangtongii]MCD9197788.1 MMPL family transporter [Aeromicrobium wangtongii]UUP15270.1 MMPL family transporter [Aeromicrobium wangtongii]